jgi:hypothetical protein
LHPSVDTEQQKAQGKLELSSARAIEGKARMASNDDIDRLIPGVSPKLTLRSRETFFGSGKSFTYPQRSADTAHSSEHIMSYSKLERESGNKLTGMWINSFFPFSLIFPLFLFPNEADGVGDSLKKSKDIGNIVPIDLREKE